MAFHRHNLDYTSYNLALRCVFYALDVPSIFNTYATSIVGGHSDGGLMMKRLVLAGPGALAVVAVVGAASAADTPPPSSSPRRAHQGPPKPNASSSNLRHCGPPQSRSVSYTHLTLPTNREV